MEKRTGERVPFPDVSNTRYGTHGEAAATLLVHLDDFRAFVPFIANKKERPGLTNIEKNLKAALDDIPTLTELAAMALYCIAISRPFMGHVRKHENLLKLGSFFEKKAALLQSVIDDPTLWTGNDVSHEKASLGSDEWDADSLRVLHAIQELAPSLPHLNLAVAAFASGAREAFVDRFSDEFAAGGDIDRMSQFERNHFFFASTNDANEGGLGSWRRGQTLKPAETLHKFNAGFKARRNDTEAFAANKLTTAEDLLFNAREARRRDASGLEKQRKVAQIAEDERRAEEGRKKVVKKQTEERQRETALKETAANLITDLSKINVLGKDELIRQLDFHRNAEKKLLMDQQDRIPAKSNIGNNDLRKAWLTKALTRYLARNPIPVPVPGAAVTVGDEDVQMADPSADAIYLSDYDDDMV